MPTWSKSKSGVQWSQTCTRTEVPAANGMIANLYGPVEGRSHDAGIPRQSGLLEQLEIHSNTPDDQPLCIYGDPAYPQREHLQAPYKHSNLSEGEKAFNSAMSNVRVSGL